MSNEERIAEIKAKFPHIEYVRTDRNDTLYFNDYTCRRCGGRGGADQWAYTGYTCYECGGSGRTSSPQVLKFYTPEYEAKLAAARKARAEEREKAAYKKMCNSYGERMEKLGFTKEGEEWVIYYIKGQTFEMKDRLKELGCKYRPAIGWYSARPLEGYDCERYTSAQVLEPDNYPLIEWRDATDLDNLLHPTMGEWIGEVGAIYEGTVTVEKRFEFMNQFYGHTTFSNKYIMRDEQGNVLTWSTAKDLKEGSTICIHGKIKDHVEYKHVKQTALTRCTWKEI